MFNDYENIESIVELNPTRRYFFNNFLETIPISRIRVTLSIINDVILKNNDHCIEIFMENFDDLRSNILYMISFEKVIREEEAN